MTSLATGFSWHCRFGSGDEVTLAPKSTANDIVQTSGKVAKLPKNFLYAFTDLDKMRVDVLTSLLIRHRTFA